jgi:hypothetical protein
MMLWMLVFWLLTTLMMQTFSFKITINSYVVQIELSARR